MSPSNRPLRAILDPRDPAPASRVLVHAWLALQRHAAYRPAQAKAWLERGHGPAEVIAALGGGTPGRVLAEAELARDCAELARHGVRLVPFGSESYPARIALLPDAAPLLAVRGDPRAFAGVFVAIVGARVATRLGTEIAFHLARDLAANDVGIVSGLARGIDAAAHRGALAARGTTVAFLGCGPDQIYPSEHRALALEIAASGAIASELPVGAPPAKPHFPLRNRLISGLAHAVVVVEARARSGSLVTARHAADQGREVMAVPGSVGAPTSEGPNQLLRAGAWPVLDASDVLAAIGLGPASPAERASQPARPASSAHTAEGARPASRAQSTEQAPMPPEGHPIVRALRREPQTRDELAASLDWSPQRLARELLPLELDGAVAEERDGRLHVAPRI